jgi:hypothetical protein
VNDGFERAWKEAAMLILSRNLPEWAEKNHENFNKDSLSPGQDLIYLPSTKQKYYRLGSNVRSDDVFLYSLVCINYVHLLPRTSLRVSFGLYIQVWRHM